MSAPDVSVVVSTRNRAATLDACLASLAGQRTDAAYEVLVVDNGSRDATPDVVARWCERDRRFQGVHEPRVGLSVGKNAGAAAARGSLLAFTDDDVLADPGWVEALVRATTDERVVVGGRIVPVAADLAPYPAWLGDACLDDLGLLDHGAAQELPAGRWVWGANLAVPTGLFREVGGFDEGLGRRGDERGTFEDTDFQDRARRCGARVLFCPDAVVQHRVPRESARPAALLAAAFVRGGNARYQADLGTGSSGRSPLPAAGRPRAPLAVQLAAWVACAGAFRVVGGRRAFAAAHRRAWCCGWQLADARATRADGVRLPERGTVLSRRAALRLAGGQTR